MPQTFGASAILKNLRENMPCAGALDQGVSLSSLLANVSLTSYLQPQDGVAIASFRAATAKPTTESLIAGIQRFFKNELTVVPGSLRVTEPGQFFTSVSAHLVRNTVSRSLGPDGIPQGFVSLSKNIFMEERDSTTWKLVTSKDGHSQLVRDNSVETDQDMEKLMASLSSSGHQYSNQSKEMAAHASSLIEQIETGVMVAYVVGNEQQIGFAVESVGEDGKFGVVRCSGEIADHAYADAHAASVIGIVPLSEYLNQLHQPSTDEISLSAGGRADLNVMVEYYRKVAGYNKEFLNQFLSRLRNSSLALG